MKSLLLSLIVLSAFSAGAVDTGVWYAVTDRGESMKMESVDYLFAADGADVFSVVLKDGSAVEAVKELSFRLDQSSGISAVTVPGKVTVLEAENSVTVTSASGLGRVDIISADGRVVTGADAGGRTSVTLDVSAVATGYYILSAGKSAVKFYKR